ncbi:MAG: DMT family transporter [Gammaproteobacteria bacterium]
MNSREAAEVDSSTQGSRGDVVMVIAGALLISMKGILAKLLYREGVAVEAILLLRAWISLPLVWTWALYRVGPRGIASVPRNLVAGAVLAGVVSYYLGAWLDFAALTLIDASLERVLLFSYPVIVVIARAVVLRRLPSRRVVGAVLLTYLGIVLAVGGFEAQLWQANAFGAAFVLLAAAGFAYFLIANERVAREAGSVVFILFASSGAALAFAVHFALFGDPADLHVSARAFGLIVFMTAATNVLPLFMFSASIRRIGAQRAAIISSIGPPSTIVLAMLVLDEVLRPGQWFGTAMIIAGILVLEARRGRV